MRDLLSVKCYHGTRKINLINFGFNRAIPITIFIIYLQILTRTLNNIASSRLCTHKNKQRNKLIEHFLNYFYTKLHYSTLIRL